MCRMTVNVDENKKAALKAVLKKRGYTMEDAIDMYFDAILQENNIPSLIGLAVIDGPFDSVDDMLKAYGLKV